MSAIERIAELISEMETQVADIAQAVAGTGGDAGGGLSAMAEHLRNEIGTFTVVSAS